MQGTNRYVSDISDIVEGLVLAHSNQYEKVEGVNVLRRKAGAVPGKVGLVSGEGSGHESTHAGYIGDGMLDAVVRGEVIPSPTPDLFTIKYLNLPLLYLISS